MVTGPMEPRMSTMRLRPKSALSSTMTAMRPLPTICGTPKYWLSVAPAPDTMMMPTRKQNRMVNHSRNVPRYLPQK